MWKILDELGNNNNNSKLTTGYNFVNAPRATRTHTHAHALNNIEITRKYTNTLATCHMPQVLLLWVHCQTGYVTKVLFIIFCLHLAFVAAQNLLNRIVCASIV